MPPCVKADLDGGAGAGTGVGAAGAWVGAWSVFVLVLMALGLSAAYELLEWQTAVWKGASADAFLGSQGDPWDTQWDMACALIGASAALLLLSGHQDRDMKKCWTNPSIPENHR